jgi:small conductance mechanosensitive channel
MQETWTKISEYLLAYGLKIIGALLIFLVGKWLARLLSNWADRMMDKANLEKTLASFAKNLLYVGLMVFVITAALGKLGVETTSFIAVMGAAGLAVGLALQGSLSNFAAGILIVLFRPFKVGEFIQTGSIMGTVQEIQIFNTVLSAPDNRKEIVPNGKIMADTITNFTAIDKRRIDLVFGVSYKDDIRKAKQILEQTANSDPRVLKDPKTVVAVSELGESSVNLVCRPWVKPADYWDVYFNLVENGKLELEKNGITIPFPQRDIHHYQEKTSAGE